MQPDLEVPDSAFSVMSQPPKEISEGLKLMSPANLGSALAFLANDPNLDLAMVFGSTAKGTARPHSDIDIAVYPRQPLGHQDLQRLSDQIALVTGRPVDIVDLSKSNGSLLRQILRSGKVLFSKRPGTLGALHQRLLAWQEDFEPALKALFTARQKRFSRSAHGS